MVGEEGFVVEVNDTRWGKRKYNSGFCFDCVWVVRGVERTKITVLLQEIDDRSYEDLQDIFKTYFKPGSIIHRWTVTI